MKYVDAEKLIAEIERRKKQDVTFRERSLLIDMETAITSLQQEQPSDMKSPFTGGSVAILSREEEVIFRGEKVKFLRNYYRCVDTGREFTDSKLDEDMMWAVFRAYCEKKGMTSFTDIMLKQEQPSLPSDLDEAADTFNRKDAARMWDYEGKTEGEIVKAAFKAGAEWMAGQ